MFTIAIWQSRLKIAEGQIPPLLQDALLNLGKNPQKWP